MSIWLVMQAHNGNERRFAVKPTTIIGRETTCDVRVPVPTVSQRHCQITFDGSRLHLTDLRSDRGTFHNGNRVSEAVLAPEDTLTIGPVTFIVREQSEVETDGPAEIVIERCETYRLDGAPANGMQTREQAAEAPHNSIHNT